MLRRIAISMGRSSRLRKLAMSTPGFRNVAWKLVAGEDLDAAVRVVEGLNDRGITATLNALGMHESRPREAGAAADQAVEALRRIRETGIRANVSVKLTGIGLDIDERRCVDHLERILAAARETGSFVRLDMEESPYVARTMGIFESARRQYGDATVGVVIQSYLREPPYNLGELAASGARIRLVKGGYREPASVVHRRSSEVDAAFHRDIEVLMRHATLPAIATHDAEAVRWAQRLQGELGKGLEEFEFQMLLGVRPELQASLAGAGHRVRCYIPYGGTWMNWILLAAHGAAHRVLRR